MCTTLYLWWVRWVVLEMLILGKAEIEIAYVSLTEEGVLGEAAKWFVCAGTSAVGCAG